jgi:hypothetical protein
MKLYERNRATDPLTFTSTVDGAKLSISSTSSFIRGKNTKTHWINLQTA